MIPQGEIKKRLYRPLFYSSIAVIQLLTKLQELSSEVDGMGLPARALIDHHSDTRWPVCLH